MKSIFVCGGRYGTMHFNHKGYNVTSKAGWWKKKKKILHQLELQQRTTVQLSSSVKIFTSCLLLAQKKSKLKKEKKHHACNIFWINPSLFIRLRLLQLKWPKEEKNIGKWRETALSCKKKQYRVTECKNHEGTEPWKIVKSWLFWFAVHMQSLK